MQELDIIKNFRRDLTIWTGFGTSPFLLAFSLYHIHTKCYVMATCAFTIGVTVFLSALGASRRRPIVSYKAVYVVMVLALHVGFYTHGQLVAFWCFPVLLFFLFTVPGPAAQSIALSWVVFSSINAMIYLELPLGARLVVTMVVTALLGYICRRLVYRLQDDLIRLATVDPLTGVQNRSQLRSVLEKVIARFGINSAEGAFIAILDIDHFKSINDQYGHPTGDRVLVEVAEILRSGVRKLDPVFRIGGEEFLILFRAADGPGAQGACEKLRIRISDARLLEDRPTTASFGLAGLRSGDTPESWMKRADEALYRAKTSGRNRICLEEL